MPALYEPSAGEKKRLEEYQEFIGRDGWASGAGHVGSGSKFWQRWLASKVLEKEAIERRKLFTTEGPKGSVVEWAPSTDEKARARSQDEHAEGQGANSKPSTAEVCLADQSSPMLGGKAEGGKWLGRLGLALLDVHKGTGGASLNEIEQHTWEPLPRPLVIDSGAGEKFLVSRLPGPELSGVRGE